MTYSKSKFLGLSTLFLALAIGAAACDTYTAEAPLETSPQVDEAPTNPEVGEPPTNPEVGEAPTVPDSALDPTAGTETITEVAANETSLSTFNTILESAGLTNTLDQPGSYTVFAPSDQAFEELPPETLQQLLAPENQDQLRQILAYHVVPEELSANQLQSAGSVETLTGSPLSVEADAGAQAVTVNNAAVTQPDLQASNGIIHVVDQIILPSTAVQ